MEKSNVIDWSGRAGNDDPLTDLLRTGARQLLQQAIETEVQELELLSKVVFKVLNQAATWFDAVTSIPSLNFTPVITFAR